MPKNKLQRFEEIKSFGNVFEPTLEEVKEGDYLMKGKWQQHYFKNNNPIVLELGCGKGEYTIGLGEHYRDKNFIGVDIKGARLWRGAKTAFENKINNVAFLRTRIDFIEKLFSKDEINEIWITFPDPQPRKSRSKKRLTSPTFLKRYQSFLVSKGNIHLKTDNQPLYKYTLEVIQENHYKLLCSTNNLYKEMLEWDVNTQNRLAIKTHYEKMFLEKGMDICYLQFQLQ